MVRVIGKLIWVALLLGLMGTGGAVEARPQAIAAPLKSYISDRSLLVTYYRAFLANYGRKYSTAGAAFGDFCRRLRTSDLLADRFNMMDISIRDVHTVLEELEQAHFNPSDRHQIRQRLLTIDYILETIEGAIIPNHRAEFRREVLADIPPVVSAG